MPRLWATIGLCSVLAFAGPPALAQTEAPLPHEAVLRQTLARYQGTSEHHCEREAPTRLRCAALLPAFDAFPELELDIVYNLPTRSVHLALRHLAQALPQGSETPRVLQRLAELNYETLGICFAWNPVDGEVRLSSTVPAETHLDGAALYRSLHALVSEGRRRAAELRNLARAN